MTDNLFDGINNETPVLDANKNYLEELVGENKKFKTVDEMAKGKAYADALIEVYERKMDDLRSDNARLLEESRTGATLKASIDQLEVLKQQLASSESPPAKEVNEKPTFDPSKLDSLLDDKLTQFELRKKERENFNVVQAKLQERYGDNYQRNLKQQIETLGLTSDDANALARKSPAAFMRTLGLDQAQQQDSFQAPPRSSRNDSFAPKGTAQRTWSYYQELKKKNPNLYYDIKTNIQMQKDIIELGETFKDGDFHALGD